MPPRKRKAATPAPSPLPNIKKTRSGAPYGTRNLRGIRNVANDSTPPSASAGNDNATRLGGYDRLPSELIDRFVSRQLLVPEDTNRVDDFKAPSQINPDVISLSQVNRRSRSAFYSAIARDILIVKLILHSCHLHAAHEDQERNLAAYLRAQFGQVALPPLEVVAGACGLRPSTMTVHITCGKRCRDTPRHTRRTLETSFIANRIDGLLMCTLLQTHVDGLVHSSLYLECHVSSTTTCNALNNLLQDMASLVRDVTSIDLNFSARKPLLRSADLSPVLSYYLKQIAGLLLRDYPAHYIAAVIIYGYDVHIGKLVDICIDLTDPDTHPTDEDRLVSDRLSWQGVAFETLIRIVLSECLLRCKNNEADRQNNPLRFGIPNVFRHEILQIMGARLQQLWHLSDDAAQAQRPWMYAALAQAETLYVIALSRTSFIDGDNGGSLMTRQDLGGGFWQSKYDAAFGLLEQARTLKRRVNQLYEYMPADQQADLTWWYERTWSEIAWLQDILSETLLSARVSQTMDFDSVLQKLDIVYEPFLGPEDGCSSRLIRWWDGQGTLEDFYLAPVTQGPTAPPSPSSSSDSCLSSPVEYDDDDDDGHDGGDPLHFLNYGDEYQQWLDSQADFNDAEDEDEDGDDDDDDDNDDAGLLNST